MVLQVVIIIIITVICNLQYFYTDVVSLLSDRPDCREGRLAFTFYSHLKNIKEVHVCPTHQQEGTVRGQVNKNGLDCTCSSSPHCCLLDTAKISEQANVLS